MKFSVTLGAAGDLAHLAEEPGWDAVFLKDYVDYQGTGRPVDNHTNRPCARRQRHKIAICGHRCAPNQSPRQPGSPPTARID
jgi:hypothetical protein